jgi:hypothetical protein
MVGSNQYRIANGIRDEEHAPQQKGIQEYLPQRSIGLHDVTQIGAVDFEESAGFYRLGADQRSTTGQQVHVTGEFSATEDVEDSLARGGNTKHFDPATQNDEDAVVQISPLQNNFVRLRIPLAAESCQPGNLTGVKLGKPCLDLFARSKYQFTTSHRFFLSVQRPILNVLKQSKVISSIQSRGESAW